MATIGDQQLQLADDYAAALDTLADRSATNTKAALRRSLVRTLRDLRRYYGQFVDPELPDQQSADGVTRRPGSYSIADGSAKFSKLLKLAQAFASKRELAWLQNRYREDFAEAVALGGDLGQQLAQIANPDATAQGTFVGASRAAVEAAASTASAYIRGEVESFRDNIARIVTDGIGRGKGPRVLEGEIRTALQGARDPQGLNNRMGLEQRAELIARSELANAYVGAQKAAAARNGFGYARWIATKDERTCAVCASRHGRIYRLDEMVGTQHPRCVLGDVFVSPGPIAACFRSFYCGDVVTISLKDGSVFTVTAQHPVLTTRGVKPAKLLRKGSQLVGNNPEVLSKDFGSSPDLHQVPARAEDVFAAFAESGAVASVSVPGSALDLHGDGGSIKGEIDVVRAAGLLQGYWEPSSDHEVAKDARVNARVRFRPFSALGLADATVLGLGAAACGSVSSLREAHALLGGGLGHAEEHRVAAAAWSDALLAEPVNDDGATYAKLSGQCFDAHPALVQAQEVVNVKFDAFAGHVYTFETFCGFYSMGIQTRVINQNCRCSLSPVATEAVEEPDPTLRATLLREAYWERSRAAVLEEFAAAKGWPFARASQVLEQAVRKPSPSERRQYPGIERAPEPVA
jgi:SPP1 gp7 family putative phage head morphogenesis protein